MNKFYKILLWLNKKRIPIQIGNFEQKLVVNTEDANFKSAWEVRAIKKPIFIDFSRKYHFPKIAIALLAKGDLGIEVINYDRNSSSPDESQLEKIEESPFQELKENPYKDLRKVSKITQQEFKFK